LRQPDRVPSQGIKVEQFDRIVEKGLGGIDVETSKFSSVTTSAHGIYLALSDYGDHAGIAVGSDFGPGEEPLWVVEGEARQTGSRTVLTFQFNQPVGDKTRFRKVVIDFDYERFDESGDSVALPRVTVE